MPRKHRDLVLVPAPARTILGLWKFSFVHASEGFVRVSKSASGLVQLVGPGVQWQDLKYSELVSRRSTLKSRGSQTQGRR